MFTLDNQAVGEEEDKLCCLHVRLLAVQQTSVQFTIRICLKYSCWPFSTLHGSPKISNTLDYVGWADTCTY